MSFLENLIPPPLILLVVLLIMRIIASFDNSPWLQFKYNNYLALALCIIGFVVAASALLSFKAAQTTINPLEPERANTLVQTGIFKVSRNPMYLGMTLIAVAWGLYLSSAYSLIMVALFILFITRFQIKPEERALTSLYPHEFKRYRQTTRRWL